MIARSYWEGKALIVRPNVSQIAEEVGCSRRTVRRVIANLLEHGTLECSIRSYGRVPSEYIWRNYRFVAVFHKGIVRNPKAYSKNHSTGHPAPQSEGKKKKSLKRVHADGEMPFYSLSKGKRRFIAMSFRKLFEHIEVLESWEARSLAAMCLSELRDKALKVIRRAWNELELIVRGGRDRAWPFKWWRSWIYQTLRGLFKLLGLTASPALGIVAGAKPFRPEKPKANGRELAGSVSKTGDQSCTFVQDEDLEQERELVLMEREKLTGSRYRGGLCTVGEILSVCSPGSGGGTSDEEGPDDETDEELPRSKAEVLRLIEEAKAQRDFARVAELRRLARKLVREGAW